MENMKTLTIADIEKMTENELETIAEEKTEIKEHQIYFVDFGGYFGYSAVVFNNGHQIYYANDYELHHRYMNGDRERLKEFYIKSLNNKLFTADELQTVKDYEDYDRKLYYIMNYYKMRYNHISIWFYGSEEERAARKEKTKSMYYSDIAQAYLEKPERVEEINNLFNVLEEAKEKNKNSVEYWQNAFLYEMFNHEYSINLQADYDVISCFANVDHVEDYENMYKLFEAAEFTEIQITAYKQALKEYYKRLRENEDY